MINNFPKYSAIITLVDFSPNLSPFYIQPTSLWKPPIPPFKEHRPKISLVKSSPRKVPPTDVGSIFIIDCRHQLKTPSCQPSNHRFLTTTIIFMAKKHHYLPVLPFFSSRAFALFIHSIDSKNQFKEHSSLHLMGGLLLLEKKKNWA